MSQFISLRERNLFNFPNCGRGGAREKKQSESRRQNVSKHPRAFTFLKRKQAFARRCWARIFFRKNSLHRHSFNENSSQTLEVFILREISQNKCSLCLLNAVGCPSTLKAPFRGQFCYMLKIRCGAFKIPSRSLKLFPAFSSSFCRDRVKTRLVCR